MCCGRATLSYSGITLASALWKSYFGLLTDHFGQCAVEELLRHHSGEYAVEALLWATQGSLWPVCCGRATLGYSGITLGSVLWKSYFGLLRDHFGQCAVEELSWATGRTEVRSSKNLTTPQSYGWGTTENKRKKMQKNTCFSFFAVSFYGSDSPPVR